MPKILALYHDFEGAKNIQVLLSPYLGLWRLLKDTDWGLAAWSWFVYGHLSTIHQWSELGPFKLFLRCKEHLCPLSFNFDSLSWFWRCKEHPGPVSPDSGVWRMQEVPDWDLACWSWLLYGEWFLIHPYSEFFRSILILKVQRTSVSFKSSFVALEGPEGSWLGCGILILIWIW